MSNKVTLGQLSTGVPGLDTLLSGGLSEFSFNVISGAPGSCKTTLAHQIMFALAGPQRKALFFTVVGEPPLKMLRYQQQYSFFDINKVGSSIRYVNLADDLQSGDFEGVLARIFREVEEFQPGLIFVDSFRSVVHTAKPGNEGISDLQDFVQKLGVQMATWQATTFLIGEYSHDDPGASPIFTVADGLIHLSQHLHDNYVVRKIRIVKMRGQPHLAGLHTFRISDDGLHIFPRQIAGQHASHRTDFGADGKVRRLAMGTDGLDEMLGGGLPAGYSMLIVGPSGSGKTTLAANFLAAGAKNGETAIFMSFERWLSNSLHTSFGELVKAGSVAVIENRSLGLSIEEILDDLLREIEQRKATRVVIDSLSAMELSLAPEFRHNFHESVFLMVAGLTAGGVSVLVTAEQEDKSREHKFSLAGTAFLADALLALRYYETDGHVHRAMSVVKVRGSEHSNELRSYKVTEVGVIIGELVSEYGSLLSGHAMERGRS
jgi:circadian clock protein KaiC